MRIIFIIILMFIVTSVSSQVMKPVTDDSLADFRISMVSDSNKADMVIFLTKIKSTSRKISNFWFITTGKNYDFTYKIVHYTDNPDFTIWITNCNKCVSIRSEFLRGGLSEFKKWKLSK